MSPFIRDHTVSCHPTKVSTPHLNPGEYAGTQFTYPTGMEGWVGLSHPAMEEPGVDHKSDALINHYTTEPPCEWCFTDKPVSKCLVNSTPGLGVYYFLSLTTWLCLSVCLYVCVSRCSFKLLLLFCFSMELSHFWPPVLHVALIQNFFFDFWFRPRKPRNLLPKICTCTKSPISRLVWQIDRKCLGRLGRGVSGMADSVEPCKMLWNRLLLPWQRHFGKFWLFFDKIAYKSACMTDRPDMFEPTRGQRRRPGGPSLLPWQRHLR